MVYFLVEERAGSEYSITLGEMKLINAGDGKVSSFSENMYTSILTLHNPLGFQVHSVQQVYSCTGEHVQKYTHPSQTPWV